MYCIVNEAQVRHQTLAFGEMIRVARMEQAISRENAGILAGISTATVRRIEQGDLGAHLRSAFALMLALGIDLGAEMARAATLPDASASPVTKAA